MHKNCHLGWNANKDLIPGAGVQVLKGKCLTVAPDMGTASDKVEWQGTRMTRQQDRKSVKIQDVGGTLGSNGKIQEDSHPSDSSDGG